MEIPKQFRKLEPKEPKIYRKAGKCPEHKIVLMKGGHKCCECCCGGGCDPEYTCPKCQEIYKHEYAIWCRKFCHIVAISDSLPMVVEKGFIQRMPHDLVYMQFLHDGIPIKMGSWCKLGRDGLLTKASKPCSPPMIIIS